MADVADVAILEPETRSVATPGVAWLPVGLIAGGVFVLLLATSGLYGFFGDELYFIAAGRHLAWGYADQPPLVPFLAFLADKVAPGSVVVLRLPSDLFSAAGVVVAALICREFGGRARAQALTAGAYAVSPFFLVGAGHTLATHSPDAFLWTVLCWLVVRWVRLRDDRLLLAAGVVTAIDLQAKLLVPVFWVTVLGAALIFGPRRLPFRPMLLIGGAITVLSIIPYFWWQATHGWPEREMAQVVNIEVDGAGGRHMFLEYAAKWTAGPLGTVLFMCGVWMLFRSPRLRPYRFFGAAAVATILIFWLSDGRPLYVAGVMAVGWAAALAELQDLQPARWVLSLPVVIPVYAVALGLTIWGLPVALPILSASTYAGQPYSAMHMNLEEVGWQQLGTEVTAAVHSLPAATQRDTVVMTSTYWQASAVDVYGDQNIPVYSPSRGYYYFGTPADSATTVVFVSAEPTYLHRWFADVRQIGTVNNGQNINNGNQGAPIWLCEHPLRPWSVAWPEMRHMTFF